MSDRRRSVARRRIPDRRTGDRRDVPRQESQASIRFLRAGLQQDRVMRGELLDVSPIGVRLGLESNLAPNETLLIELRDDQGRCFNLTAEVVWSEPLAEDRFQVGCELCIELSGKQYRLLQRFVRNEESSSTG